MYHTNLRKMNTVYKLFMSLALAANFTDTIAQTDINKQERNRQTTLASIQAYVAGDMNVYLNSRDKNYTYYSYDNRAVQGVDSLALTNFRALFVAAFSNYDIKVLSISVDRDYVITWEETSGTWTGNFLDVKPTGKSFRIRGVTIFKFNEAGKIVEERSIENGIEMVLQQVGMYTGAELDLNRAGRQLLSEKNLSGAADIFKLVVKLFPASWYGYTNLAKAYSLLGNKPLAIENYQKSLALHPQDELSKKELAKLQATK